MGQQTVPKIPVIHFGEENLRPGTPSWSSTCNDVRRAFEEYGCFVLVYDLIPDELRDELFRELDKLFDLPTETKAKNTHEMSLFGYIGKKPHLRSFEGTRINDATNLESVRRFSNLMWPDGNDKFCELAYRIAKLFAQFDILLHKMVFESYNIDKYCDNHINSTAHILRLNKFESVDSDEEKYIGLGTHADKSFTSILLQNKISGLEVQTKDGEWISVEFLPSSFVVMAGEAMQAWSNGRVRSAVHRVLMGGKETRYSLGTFSYHKGIVEIPEELIDEEHPPCYKSFNHLGFMNFFCEEQKAGRKLMTDLATDYCGV